MSQLIRLDCNDCTSGDDKSTEDEKEKKSVDFDCESDVHNTGMKSNRQTDRQTVYSLKYRQIYKEV